MQNQSNFLIHLSILFRNTQKYFDKVLAQYDIGSGQLIFLFSIYEHEGITMQEVTQIGELDKGTTTKSIQKLIEQGYIQSRIDENDHRVYAMLGDGECEEGQVWEAAMAASHYHLDNLCAIVDFNGLQIDGNVQDVMNPTPIDKKFEAFGWNTINIDGHDFDDIRNAFKVARECKVKPTMILAHTIKGKGVSYMENAANWHGVAPNEEQLKIALEELEGK